MLKRNSIRMSLRPQYLSVLGQQGRERQLSGACSGSQGPSWVEGWSRSEPLAPGLGPGLTGIRPVLPGGWLQPEQEDGSHHGDRKSTTLDTYLASASSTWKGGLWARSAI